MNKKTIIASMLALGIFGAMLAGCGAQQPQQQTTTATSENQGATQGSTSLGSLADNFIENPKDGLDNITEEFTELPADVAEYAPLIGNASNLVGAKGSFSGYKMTSYVYRSDKSPADVAKEYESYLKSNGYSEVTSDTMNDNEYMIFGTKGDKSISIQIIQKDGKTAINVMIIG